ncbi:MAG: 2-C-methyl-D-erythritol 4-phosphate cytidylyltransferase [Ignavibacteriales bacterium]|nr:2-C-methyl-D-erythritol 4-phosphate cytidylyltransferase [Ignavibacteriales bacterium]
MKVSAIIPSGGVGSRFNSPIPKQYIKVLGKELITYTLEVFQNCNLIDEIIIPANESYFELLNQIKIKNNFTKIVKIIPGGKERQDSVFNGLTCKNFDKDDLIVVHDAARPLLSNSLLENAIQKAEKFDSIVVAIKARDTLIESSDLEEKIVLNYFDRSKIYYAQTPQIFRYRILHESFLRAKETNFLGTDESMLVKKANFDVKIVEGEFQNFKITTQTDLQTFEKMLK